MRMRVWASDTCFLADGTVDVQTTVVSRSQTQTDVQGLIASKVNTRAVRVWATDTAKFVLATTQNCEGVN